MQSGLRPFSRGLDRLLVWARSPRADWYLGIVSFAESSLFPLPPDLLLAPMVVARPERVWRLASLTTVTSVAGGAFGFLLGACALGLVGPALQRAGYWEAYLLARQWFEVWGAWCVLAAGFSPIPYKVFTVAAGAMSLSFPVFLVASALGRGARFFLVGGLLARGGARAERELRRCIDGIGWASVGLGACLLAYARLAG